MPAKKKKYTCVDYRTEMMLLGLTKRLSCENLSKEEEKTIRERIKEIEKELGID